jgi:hypothetical protein
LDWHHSNTRAAAAPYVFNKVLAPKLGVTVSENDIIKSQKELEKGIQLHCYSSLANFHSALDGLENYWLKSSPFLAGTFYIYLLSNNTFLGTQVSIADLSAACELSQLFLVNYDFASRQNLNKWFSRMKAMEGFDQINVILEKVKAKL